MFTAGRQLVFTGRKNFVLEKNTSLDGQTRWAKSSSYIAGQFPWCMALIEIPSWDSLLKQFVYLWCFLLS